MITRRLDNTTGQNEPGGRENARSERHGARERLPKRRTADWVRLASVAAEVRNDLRSCAWPALDTALSLSAGNHQATELLRGVRDVIGASADRLRMALKK
ncbi:MAG: hypothetical protein ACR2NN_29105 [Bryobacteraceae bacterium]